MISVLEHPWTITIESIDCKDDLILENHQRYQHPNINNWLKMGGTTRKTVFIGKLTFLAGKERGAIGRFGCSQDEVWSDPYQRLPFYAN